VLLGFLVLLAATGWTVSQWSQRASDERQRENEAELLWVGGQYRQAIESYYNGTPVGVKVLPTKLDELIEDKRFPQPRRHLRRLYTDPMNPGKRMLVLKVGRNIVGVRSASTAEPFRHAGFEPGDEKFADAVSYADWQFVASVRGLSAATAASGASAPVAGASAPAFTTE
jgi:type II secretory pathway pseudopilin PulG